MKKNVYQSTTKIVTNKETYEIEVIKTQKIEINPESFYMVFIDYLAPLFSLKNGTSKAILSKLCSMAAYNTGRVSLSTADRHEICEELNISKNVLSISLKELYEKKLISWTRGSYIINPQIFWKGDLETRNAYLKNKSLQISFEIVPDEMGLDVVEENE